jgi:hypothetical protein
MAVATIDGAWSCSARNAAWISADRSSTSLSDHHGAGR